MVDLHVRNLPPGLHARLQQEALAEGRSVSAEAVVILGRALAEKDRSAARRAAVGTLRDIGAHHDLRPGTPPAEELVREDRDTR